MKISIELIEKILIQSFKDSTTQLDPQEKIGLLYKLQDYFDHFTNELVTRSIENKPSDENPTLNEKDIERIIGLLLLDM
ncbi:inner kinetochore subunit Mhf2p [Monosporozyma unispora]|nr:hypothetical protein C6P44_004569 [Kazachstania unispora]